MIKLFFFSLFIIYSNSGFSSNADFAPETISTQELIEFQSNSPRVKTAIEMGLQLANRNLGYKYGSADPALGGMDCSGTIYYLLTKLGVKSPPRSSDELYNWVKKEGVFYSTSTMDSKDLNYLKPGDLLFWSGTYAAPENAYVTHVMMYLGKNAKGELLMIGSSNGRTYKGRKIYGVSVFDFFPNSSSDNGKFLGFSCIPQLSCKNP
ncbi:MAG: NlpC/P60 family protein [Legionella sp.]|nr:NlpC/P60 family protein [Legionella sp.]